MISESIVIFNKKKDFIVKQIMTIPEVIKINDSFDYLLDLKIHTLTEEKIVEFENKMKSFELELNTLKSTSVENMWSSELLSLAY